LDGEADGQAGPLDVLGWSAAAVDPEQVTGVAFEVDAEVGADPITTRSNDHSKPRLIAPPSRVLQGQVTRRVASRK
jgi:hypothetical protein